MSSMSEDREQRVSIHEPLSMLDSMRRAHARAAALVKKDFDWGERPLMRTCAWYFLPRFRTVAIAV